MAVLTAILIADGGDFVSHPVAAAELTFVGLAGDIHAGMTRPACSRMPWHPRRTPVANTRQISLLSVEECAVIADLLGVDEIDPALLGANLVVSGLDDLSATAPATRLQFPSGATIFITEENGPCRQVGRKLAQAFDRPALEFDFVKAATRRRGLLGLVEREGAISPGDVVKLIASPNRRTG